MNNFETTMLFTEYLNETQHNVTPFSTMGWLSWIDVDSLSMLQRYVDNLSIETPDDKINYAEVRDLYQLVKALVALETDALICELEDKNHIKYTQYFCIMVDMASMKRKDIITFKGDGKMIGEDTTFSLTEFGKTITDILT